MSFGDKFTKWSSIVATVGTSILALTATITVAVTLNAWKIDRESSRPYLSLREPPKVELKSGLKLEFKFTNVGIHPAENLASRTIVFEEKLQDKPIQNEPNYLVNEIPQDMSSSLVIALDSYEVDISEPYVSPYYIVLHLEYADPIIYQQYEQTLYFRWSGIDGGEVQPVVHVEVGEKENIVNYFKAQSIETNL
ncbi:hypothetical protein [Desulfitobacterium sp. PCE1]|uniref:Uncharacterized protein n=1 Tax=Desulfitobacterium dehalogenans TaxID=36854 RepID=A0A7C7D9I4_9FIRM|nr:hypothetical protein [Desulfitobacterium sp. PCE1]HHY26520.1 hypothetical protein [Desulfitobacterium dehalogenans]